MQEKIQVDVEKINAQISVVHLSGDVTSFAEEVLNKTYTQVSNTGATRIIFNFKENDYINSSGLAILISIVITARKQNQQLYMAVPSSHFQKMFRAVGLADYSAVHPNLDEALADAQGVSG